MEEVIEEDLNKTATTKVLESPKPVAFTVDFGENRPLDTTKYKSLVEKYEKFKHRRNQSLSKIEDLPKNTPKKPLTEKLPRKTSFEKEGYVSSDEKSSSGRSQLLQIEKSSKRVVQNHQILRSTVLNTALRKDLTLPLKQTNNDRMTQSFPSRSFDLPTIDSPELELKDVSSPDMDLISPLSPFVSSTDIKSIKNQSNENITSSSEDCMVEKFKSCVEINENEINEKETDNVSEAGTYTIETDNYTEEQKQRMSIDQDFDIEHVPSGKKTEEYVQNLMIGSGSPMQITDVILQKEVSVPTNFNNRVNKVVNLSQRVLKSEYSPTDDLEDRGVFTLVTASGVLNKQQKKLHQNSHNLVKSVVALETYPSNLITENRKSVRYQNSDSSNNSSPLHKSYKSGDSSPQNSYSPSKGSFKIRSGGESPKNSGDSSPQLIQPPYLKTKDNSNFEVSYMSKSGRDSPRFENYRRPKSGRESPKIDKYNPRVDYKPKSGNCNDSPRFENSRSLSGRNLDSPKVDYRPKSGNESLHYENYSSKSGSDSPRFENSRLKTGRESPKIDFGRGDIYYNEYEQPCDLSDSSLETESYLKPTQKIISSLQQRLSIDSDSDEQKFALTNLPLNNEAESKIFKHKTLHVRHNSFDDRAIKLTNKLEHFQNKNFIDQTNLMCKSNQYKLTNSPIRRSSSFSLKNQFDNLKYLNTQVKDQNTTKKNQNIQRSSSTANIKPKIELNRRASINSDPQERNNYIETDSSSEDDYEKNLTSKPKKDLTTTRYNRAFSLRRARLDIETPPSQPKCPNTPEMKRKFAERTVSVDRKSSLHQSISSKNSDVQPRYMNITKAPPKSAPPKSDNQLLRNNNSNSNNPNPKNLPKPQPSFSRTDSGRFSLRSPRINVTNKNVPNKKDPQGKKQSGPRSNSTLSSREVEFQNWKRRKSYDPMKAAAEGKRKAELAKKGIMTQSYNENNQDYDSSPSHSSSVHRSQSFHGTAALEQNLISSEDDELTLSGEDGFSPPIPSPSHQNINPIINKNQIKAKFWKDKFQK